MNKHNTTPMLNMAMNALTSRFGSQLEQASGMSMEAVQNAVNNALGERIGEILFPTTTAAAA